ARSGSAPHTATRRTMKETRAEYCLPCNIGPANPRCGGRRPASQAGNNNLYLSRILAQPRKTVVTFLYPSIGFGGQSEGWNRTLRIFFSLPALDRSRTPPCYNSAFPLWHLSLHFERCATTLSACPSSWQSPNPTTKSPLRCRNVTTRPVLIIWCGLFWVDACRGTGRPRTSIPGRQRLSRTGARQAFCGRILSLRSTAIPRRSEFREALREASSRPSAGPS